MADSKIIVKLPRMVGTQEFTPTGLMIQVLVAFLECLQKKESKTPIECLKGLGRDTSSWYKWREKPNFNKWWTKSIEDFHEGPGLSQVYVALLKAALAPGGATDRKLYLERFDEDYKPSSKLELDAYPGKRPPSADDTQSAIERSKARAAAFQKKVEQDETSKADQSS